VATDPVTGTARLTRRRLLGGGLAAGGAALLGRAAPALASGAPRFGRAGVAVFDAPLPAPALAARTPSGWIESAPVRAGRPFDVVGVEWDGLDASVAQLRVLGPRGAWSPWIDVGGHHGHGPDGPLPPRGISDPVWAGGAELVQVRARAPWPAARLHFVDVSGARPPETPARAALAAVVGPAAHPLASPVLNAGAGQPPIIARRVWTHGRFLPSQPPGYGEIKLAFVHHTQTANGYGPGQSAAMVLSIAHYHRDVLGWHDVGYNFLVDRFGQIFEGRAGGIDEAVVGAQAGGYNLESTGVGTLGSFQASPPPPAAMRAIVHLLAWKLSLHGLPALGQTTVRVSAEGAVYSRYPAGTPVALDRISGHRDGDSTDCPGTAFYRRLPSLRQQVDGLVTSRAVLTLGAGPPAPPPAGAPGQAPAAAPGPPSTPPSGPLTLEGRLTLADGSPIPAAPISVQSRASDRGAAGESTVAGATTGPDGTWSATVAAGPGSRLRAVYAGDASHPAVISPALAIGAPTAAG